MSAELTITWSPFLPWPALAALAGFVALMLALSLWRRADGAWWRAAAVVLLLMILANPSLVEEQRQALSDIVLVVVDDSPSQGIETRREQSEAALNHVLERLGQ